MAETQPDLTDGRKDRDIEARDETRKEELGTVQNGENKSSEPSSSRGSKAEKVQSAKQKEEGARAKPSKLKEMWAKIGLDMGTVLMMFK
jgi:hypothetical protein